MLKRYFNLLLPRGSVVALFCITKLREKLEVDLTHWNKLKSLYLVISWRFIGNISKFRDHYACQLRNNERCCWKWVQNRTEGRKKSKIESRAAKSPKSNQGLQRVQNRTAGRKESKTKSLKYNRGPRRVQKRTAGRKESKIEPRSAKSPK